LSEQAQLLRQIRLALQSNNYPAAISGLLQAARAAHAENDRASEGRHLGNLALLYYRIGRPAESLHYFEQALESARADGDRITEDGLLGNMGNILRELRRFDEAIDYLSHALIIAQEIGDVRGRGIWLGNMGLVYDDLHQPEKAVEYHAEAVAVARQIQDQRGLAARLGNLGNSYVSMAEYEQAVKPFSEAAIVFRALGDRQALALRLGILGNLYSQIGRQSPRAKDARHYIGLALDHYQQTLEVARELEDRVSEAELLRSMGNLFTLIGSFHEAIDHLGAAGQTFAELGLLEQLQQVQDSLDAIRTHLDEQQSQ
jgi:tetratricopeptide (TPR) repeat protein